MNQLEQKLTSLEVAEMVEKDHSKLLRDIRTYSEQINEAKIGLADFFTESTYVDAKGETRPCFNVTKKGCELIANKLTGTKGTIFTTKYVNKFHDMANSTFLKKKKHPHLYHFGEMQRIAIILKFTDEEKVMCL